MTKVIRIELHYSRSVQISNELLSENLFTVTKNNNNNKSTVYTQNIYSIAIIVK